MRYGKGWIVFAGLSSFLLCGASSPSGCTSSNDQIGPSKGEVIGLAVGVGAAIAVGTIVIVEVNKSHHTLKGCVTVGPDGVLLHNDSDQKSYALTGITANVKVGDIVKVRGNRNKKQKDSAGTEGFVVTNINRDYGPCKATESPAAGMPAASTGQ